MTSVADRASRIPERIGDAPWPGHEYVRGWGVFGLPFDSGHVLALRVFPEGSFAPYRTVWVRDPAGRWAIHVDAPALGIACPRYYGAACGYVGAASISVRWTGPRTLHVTVDRPSLDWTVTLRRSPVLGVLNPVNEALPLASWRPSELLRARELLGRALGMGHLQLAGTMPSGHVGTLMPRRMYLVADSTATLDGADLGRPTRLRTNPTIGGVPLPARGVLAIGQAMWQARDAAEFEQARTSVSERENA